MTTETKWALTLAALLLIFGSIGGGGFGDAGIGGAIERR